MGFVYYANYFVYFEMARSELLREAGMPYAEMEKNGILLPVLTAHCEYRKPGHFDDLLDIRTWFAGIDGLRVKIEYEILRGDQVIVTGYTEHVCMSPEGKAIRPCAELKRLAGGLQKEV